MSLHVVGIPALYPEGSGFEHGWDPVILMFDASYSRLYVV
jgi:hypothetical protein